MAKKKIRGKTIKLADANKADYIVRKNDGINIDTVTFPSDVQIGLASGKNSNLTVTGQIKGSIQETKDGLPYLVAGTGITIATGSNGQVTIESSGGGASGDITSVIAGNGLTGGGLTGDVTLNVGSGTGIDVGGNSISVDVSDFMSNGAANRILTATGPDTMQAESLLLFDGTTLSVPNKIKVSGDVHLTNTDPFLVTNSTNLKVQSSGSIWAQIDDGGDKTSSFRIYSGSQIIMNVESSNFSTTFPAGDIFITNNNDLRLNTGGTIVLDNNSDSEVYLSSSSGLSLDIDSNNILNLYADNNIIHYLGDHQAGTYSRNSFNAGNNTFNVDNDDMDFRVHTSNYEGTFFVDAGDDTVIIGAQDFDSTPAASELLSKGYGNDVKIMLSGTYDSKDSSTRGVVLMTGDTTVSGNLYIAGDTSAKRKISSIGSMEIRSIDGTTSVVGDNNVNVWIGYDGAGSNQSFSIYKGTGGYEQIFVVSEDKSVRIFGELDVESNLVVHLDYDSDNSNSYFGTKNGGGTFNQVFYEDGRAYFNYSRQSTGNFIVNGDNDYGLIFVDAGEDAVALGSAIDINPNWSELTETGTDVKVLLSGTIGSKDGSTRGVTLAAGDFAASGSIYTGGNLLSLDSTLALNASSEVSSFVSSNKNATYSSATEFNTNRADVDFEVNTDDYYGTFFIDGNDNTIIIGHELFDSSPSASEVSGYGNDVKIMLSGSAGSKDTSNRGVVLVTGDLVVSGTTHLTNLTSPGSILSFRNFNTVNAEDFDVPTSFNFIEGITSGKAYITFDAPSTGNVELEFSVYVEQTGAGADLFMALSTNGSTWTTISNTDVKVFDGDENDDGYRTFKWILTGLTSGTSYTYYFGAESNSSTGIDLNWGKASAAIGYPPLIMKATSLPNTIT